MAMNSRDRRDKKKRLWKQSEDCWVCGKKIKRFELATLEHIIPISLGGRVYKMYNLALSHRHCNMERGNSMDDKYIL